MSLMGSRVSLGGFAFVLAVVAVVSAVPTFIFMWFRDDVWGTRIAFALGAAVGIAVAAYCEFRLADNPGHEWGAVMALGGGLLGPLAVIRMLHDPEHPNEKWNPPRKAAQPGAPNPGQGERRDQTNGSERAGASADTGSKTRGRTGSSDRRWNRYFRPTAGQMTREEAHEVLGLDLGASADDIRAMHHRLMTKLHPDVGGSNYLASKVNEARDVLLRTDRQRAAE